MPKPELPHILDLCPTCGSPKPCVLHDEEFLKGLLGRESETMFTELEKVREWDIGKAAPVLGDVEFIEDEVYVMKNVGGEEPVELVVFDMKTGKEKKLLDDPMHQGFTVLPDGRIVTKVNLGPVVQLAPGDEMNIRMDIKSVMEEGGDTDSYVIKSYRPLEVFDFSGETVERKNLDHALNCERNSGIYYEFIKSVSNSILLLKKVELGKMSDGHDEFAFVVLDISKDPPKELGEYEMGSGRMETVKLSDGRVVIVEDDRIYLLDVKGGKADFKEAGKHVGRIENLNVVYGIEEISPGVVLMGGPGPRLSLVDFNSPNPVITQPVECGDFTSSIARVADNQVLVADMFDGKIRFVDLSVDPPKVTTVVEGLPPIYQMKALSETEVLITTDEGKLEKWQVPEEVVRKFHERQVEEEIEEMPE